MEARTTYDFADRPATLTAVRAGLPDQPVITASTYLPSGPLTTLTLGNGLTETRTFTNRYFPAGIALASGTDRLRWNYSTDNEGNILTITDALNAAGARTYGYQDIHYFLTQGDGPWGTRSWTYDKIGNRLTETRDGATDTYTYQPAPGGGRTPILSTVQTSAGTRTYTFGPAGHLEQTATGGDATAFRNDASGRLGALESSTSGVQFLYDGRGYLTRADAEAIPFLDGFETGNVCAWTAAQGLATVPVCTAPPVVRPTYSSEGLLHALQRNMGPERSYVLYFGGRPVAQLDRTGSTETWKFLTTDHLGTPIAATNMAGALLWQGGFEPFGADWSGAGGEGVFLRFPGQWEEGAWEGIEDFFYDLYRWYSAPEARYSQPDPLSHLGGPNFYLYAFANPVFYTDRYGLRALPSPAPPVIPYPRGVPPICEPSAPPSGLPGLGTLGGWGTVLFDFFFNPVVAKIRGCFPRERFATRVSVQVIPQPEEPSHGEIQKQWLENLQTPAGFGSASIRAVSTMQLTGQPSRGWRRGLYTI